MTMKLRAVATDENQIQYLIKVLQSMCRLSTSFYIRLSANQMQLITERAESLSAFLVKCRLNSSDYFQDYCFRGVGNENLIYLQIRSQCLTQVFNSLSPNIKTLKLKLSHRCGRSVLAVAADYPTADTDRSVRHDMRVDVIREQLWSAISDPDWGSFDLSLYLSESRTVGSTVERLNDLCQYIVVKAKAVADSKAVLTVGAETDSIAVKTKFNDLNLYRNPDLGSGALGSALTTNWVKVRVDVKRLNLIFSTLKHLKPTSIVCNISDKNRLYLQFFHNFVNFQAILPNVDK